MHSPETQRLHTVICWQEIPQGAPPDLTLRSIYPSRATECAGGCFRRQPDGTKAFVQPTLLKWPRRKHLKKSLDHAILLMEEILHQLRHAKHCKSWDIYHIKWCGISSINSMFTSNPFCLPLVLVRVFFLMQSVNHQQKSSCLPSQPLRGKRVAGSALPVLVPPGVFTGKICASHRQSLTQICLEHTSVTSYGMYKHYI